MKKKQTTLKQKLIWMVFFLIVWILSTALWIYKDHPEDLTNISEYLPGLLGALTSFAFIFYFMIKKNGSGLNTVVEDERDFNLAEAYTYRFFSWFFITTVAILITLQLLDQNTLSTMSVMLYVCLTFFVYGIGLMIFRKAHS